MVHPSHGIVFSHTSRLFCAIRRCTASPPASSSASTNAVYGCDDDAPFLYSQCSTFLTSGTATPVLILLRFWLLILAIQRAVTDLIELKTVEVCHIILRFIG